MLKHISPQSIVISLGILTALLTWLFGARPFIVNGASMYTAFNSMVTEGAFIGGDYLFIDLFTYTFSRDPSRLDVVVARSPIEEKRFILKRVVGLPNETVTITRNQVSITDADGTTTVLEEPYVNPEIERVYEPNTWTLGPNQYFVMGDNRSNSLDSRNWGPLNRENVLGRVLVRIYPFSEVGWFPGRV